MKRRAAPILIAACLALMSAPSQAVDTAPPELPPLAQVRLALLKAPEVLASQALIGAEDANRRRLEAGNAEWVVRLTGQQRQVRPTPEQRYTEWDVALERSLRLPGKARLDAELGKQSYKQAETAYGDALHEAGRSLLKAWFGWLKEKSAREQWDSQIESLTAQARATARRVELGDAPKLDALTANAALAQAKASRQQALAKEKAAETELRQHYPALTLPTRLDLPDPPAPEGTATIWLEQVAGHSHELQLAKGESRKAQLTAARADADRSPDPTVGLRHASERGGEERITGLVLSIPLSGVGRQAASDHAQALAESAAHREAAALVKLRGEVLSLVQAVEASHQAWQAAREAAMSMAQAADLTRRAQQLGEAPLAEVLTSRRLAHEAALNERLARLDALENRRRLELDAHRLWDLDEE